MQSEWDSASMNEEGRPKAEPAASPGPGVHGPVAQPLHIAIPWAPARRMLAQPTPRLICMRELLTRCDTNGASGEEFITNAGHADVKVGVLQTPGPSRCGGRRTNSVGDGRSNALSCGAALGRASCGGRDSRRDVDAGRRGARRGERRVMTSHVLLTSTKECPCCMLFFRDTRGHRSSRLC